MKPVAPAKWLAGVCAAMDLALTQWELRLILHRGEKQETKFMMSSITYLRHDLLSSLLIRPKRTQGACQFPHSHAMSDAAYSSSAAVAANAAVAADAQPAHMVKPILAGGIMMHPSVVTCKTLSEESVHAYRVPIRVSMILLQPSAPAATVAESSATGAAVAAKRRFTGKRLRRSGLTEDAKKPQEKPEEADDGVGPVRQPRQQ